MDCQENGTLNLSSSAISVIKVKENRRECNTGRILFAKQTNFCTVRHTGTISFAEADPYSPPATAPPATRQGALPLSQIDRG